MQVVYSGAHPKVIVDELDTEQIIERGTPVDVPDDLGASLIEQDTWSQVPAKASPAAASAPAPNPQPNAATPATAAPAASESTSAPADPTPTKGNS